MTTISEKMAICAFYEMTIDDAAKVTGQAPCHVQRYGEETGTTFGDQQPRVKMSPFVSKDTLAHIQQTGRMPR